MQGNDLSDGSIAKPVKTLERAIALAREERQAGFLEEIVIYMREGVYKADKPISIDGERDNPGPLKIAAYKGEEVRITGGAEFRLADMKKAGKEFTDKVIDEGARPKILEYDLAEAGIEETGAISRRGFMVSANQTAQAELSVDGTVQRLAAWPNGDFVGHEGIVEPGDRSSAGITNGCSFKVGFDRPAYWGKQNEVWVSGVLGPNYTYDYYPMERYDSDSKTVYLREGAAPGYHYSKQFFKFENIPEELDAPGEYYIDSGNKMLYYYPSGNENEQSVFTITMLKEDLLNLSSVEDITFSGITLSGGRAAAVVGRNVSGIEFNDCDIHSFGGDGIIFRDAENVRIDGCRIHDTGRNGVMITGGDYARLVSGNNVIYNNDIYNFSRLERSYYSGVYLGYRSVGTLVKRNHIHDGPHAGLIMYGANHRIERNEFDNLVTDFHDMNAIYANISCYPWERGNVIERNFFHDIGKSVFNGEKQTNVSAIRTDNMGSGLIVEENLFYNIGYTSSNSVCGVVAQGSRNKVNRNLFVDCSGTYLGTNAKYDPTRTYKDDDKINGVTVAELKRSMNGLLPVYGRLFPELYTFFDEHPHAAATNEFNNNMVINIELPLSVTNGDLNREQGFRGTVELMKANGNYVGTADPGFLNYESGNFGLTPEALERMEGFPRLSMDDFGLLQ